MLRAKPQTAITVIYCRKYIAEVRIASLIHAIKETMAILSSQNRL